MAYINYSRELLDKFCMEAFQKFGFTKDESRIISDVLLMSDSPASGSGNPALLPRGSGPAAADFQSVPAPWLFYHRLR